MHVVVGTVVEDCPEVHHGITREVAAGGSIFDPFFNRRNEVAWNGAPEDIVDEFKFGPTRKRFHFDLADAILAMAASLLLVASLHIGFAANRLAIWNFRRLQDDFSGVAFPHLRNYDFNMLLTRACDEELLCLGIAEKAEHRIFFHELVQSNPKFVFIRATLRLDSECDGGLG